MDTLNSQAVLEGFFATCTPPLTAAELSALSLEEVDALAAEVAVYQGSSPAEGGDGSGGGEDAAGGNSSPVVEATTGPTVESVVTVGSVVPESPKPGLSGAIVGETPEVQHDAEALAVAEVVDVSAADTVPDRPAAELELEPNSTAKTEMEVCHRENSYA